MAAKKPAKKTAAKKAVKKPAAPKIDRKTEELIVKSVKALRENPEKYKELQKSLSAAKSDQAKVKQLLQYATTDRELAALIPARLPGGGASELAWTTVTITTIFIADSAY
jgi:hypothetical protein